MTFATILNVVINQINGKEGQKYFPFIFTLFMFILINNLMGLVKRRCLCLILFFRLPFYYVKLVFLQVKSYQTLIIFSCFLKAALTNKYLVRLYYSYTNISVSSYTRYSFNNNSYYLNPYYVTGFTDGEGCFSISIFKDSQMLTGFQAKPIFSISLHDRDKKLLEAIQRTLGVGKIYKHGKDSIQLRVSSLKNLKVIIAHFNKYPLITQKYADYLLFKQSVDLLEKKEDLKMEGRGLTLRERSKGGGGVPLAEPRGGPLLTKYSSPTHLRYGTALLKLISIKATLNKGLPSPNTSNTPCSKVGPEDSSPRLLAELSSRRAEKFPDESFPNIIPMKRPVHSAIQIQDLN
jgi:hypothetical protein